MSKPMDYVVSRHTLASGYRYDCKVNRYTIGSRDTQWELERDIIAPLVTRGKLTTAAPTRIVFK